MNKKIYSAVLLLVAIAIGGFFWHRHSTKQEDGQQNLQPFSFALDWTPNTNHTGIYVAQAKGWYKDRGIDLKILPYSDSVSSDVLVATGKADAGVGFTESIVSDAGAGSNVVSLASIIAHNTSIIAVRKDSKITSPKQLDGKIFGGFGAPYEKAVMGQVIKNAGGQGNFKTLTVNTSPLQALKDKTVDFVWVYSGWEGIEAKREGLQLTSFNLTDYGIPDYSTPNIISAPKTIQEKKDLLEKFMAATAEGYEYARVHPQESAKILIDSAPPGTFPDTGLVYASQDYLSPRYQDKGKLWGIQTADFWRKYPQFMVDNAAVLDASGKPVKSIDYSSLYTNAFLP